ncbi:MAG TPA: hypothetical protein VMB74_16160 [Streptosporangiaceae bacterium]|nr:hypothetical protein [Streptosporangiaceae bacterium]
MGRAAYQSMASYFPDATDDPNAEVLNAARKVVFSRTLTVADWANATVASGDLGQEVDNFRRGGNGYIVVHGGISFFRSLTRLDLIDEYRVTLVAVQHRFQQRPGARVPTAPLNRAARQPGGDQTLRASSTSKVATTTISRPLIATTAALVPSKLSSCRSAFGSADLYGLPSSRAARLNW